MQCNDEIVSGTFYNEKLLFITAMTVLTVLLLWSKYIQNVFMLIRSQVKCKYTLSWYRVDLSIFLSNTFCTRQGSYGRGHLKCIEHSLLTLSLQECPLTLNRVLVLSVKPLLKCFYKHWTHKSHNKSIANVGDIRKK